MQDEKFIRARITELRTKMNVSEYRMSHDLAHSGSYIQSISSGKALPSMSEFLYICEYLGVTPHDFFDEGLQEPALIQELSDAAKNLCEEDLRVLIHIAKRMAEK
jgi:transcriptional regulator with XRE-family HTH domain